MAPTNNNTSAPAASVPNAWAQKPLIRPEAPATARQQPKFVAGNPVTPPTQPVAFGTVRQDANAESPVKKSPAQPGMSYASVATTNGSMKRATSGSVPKEVQANIKNSKPANSDIRFGTVGQTSPTKPPAMPPTDADAAKPLAPVPGFRANAPQFQGIQRVRSAPPQLSEQEEMMLRMSQNSAQGENGSSSTESGHPHQKNGDEKSDKPAAPKNNGYLNPNASAYAPEFYPMPPQFGYPMPMYGYYPPPYGMPGQFPMVPGMPMPVPQFRPPVVAHSTKPVTANAAPFVPSASAAPVPASAVKAAPFVPSPSKAAPVSTNVVNVAPFVPAAAVAPAPTPVTPSKPEEKADASPAKPAEPAAKPVVVPAPRPKIRIVNPETGEEVKFAAKKEEKKVDEPAKAAESLAKSEEPVVPKPATPQKPAQREKSPERKPATPAATPEKTVKPEKVASPAKSPERMASAAVEGQREKSPARKPESPAKSESPVPVVEAVKVATPSKSREPSPARSEQTAIVSNQAESSPKLPTSSGKQQYRYTFEFLLSFRERCMEKPADMPMMEAVLGDDGQPLPASRRGSTRRDRGSDAGLPPRGSRMSESGRYSDMAPTSSARSMAGASFRNATGNRPPPGFGGSKSIRNSAGSRRGSARGSRSEPPPLPDAEPVAPLIKSENRWMPNKMTDKATTDKTELAIRNSRSLLNKLTIEKFDRISDKMLSLEVEDTDTLVSVIDLIFDKACDENKFCEMYARLCSKLSQQLHDFSKEAKERLREEYFSAMPEGAPEPPEHLFTMREQFRRKLLMKCQTEFEMKNDWTNIADPTAGKDIDSLTQEELAERAAVEAKRGKSKRRALGSIRFIGALFKLGMLTEKIMHECIRHLLKNVSTPEEEESESVCDLMESVGEKLDSPANAQAMAAYFDRMHILTTNNSLPSRVRFKIQDVIELRARRWQQRERQQILNAGPMKLEDVQKLAEQQRVAEARKSMAPMGGYRGSRDSGRDRDRDRRSTRPVGRQSSAADEWSVSGRRRDEPPRSALRRNDSESSTKGKEESDRPRTILSRTAAATEATEEKPKRTNTFEMLAEMENGAPSSPVEDSDDDSVADDQSESEYVFADIKKDVKSAADFEKYFSKEFVGEFLLAAEDSISSGLRVIAKARSFVKDVDMSATTFKALERIIEKVAPESLKMSNGPSRARIEILQQTVSACYQHSMVPREEMDEFVENQIINMPDMVIDVPGLDVCIGCVVGSLIVDKIVDFEFVKSAVLKLAELIGDFTPRATPRGTFRTPEIATFFAATINSIRDIEGEDFMLDTWAAVLGQEQAQDEALTPMDVLKFPWWGTDKEKLSAIPDDAVVAWLDKNGLGILLGDVEPSPAGSETPVASPTESENWRTLLKKELEGADNVTADQVKEAIDASAPSAKDRQQPEFIAQLATAFLQHIKAMSFLNDGAKNSERRVEQEKRAAEKWLPVLKHYVHPAGAEAKLKRTLQLEVTWTTQTVGNSSDLKSDDQYFYRIFELLYDLDVVDEATFNDWESDSKRQMDTKEVTMVRGARRFLSWLRRADED